MSAKSIACSLVVYHGFVGAKDRAGIAEGFAKRKGDHVKAQFWADVKAEIEEQIALTGAFDVSPMKAAGMPALSYPAQHVSRGVI